ncbi:hypothetical protein DPMN_194240 [Dreissena polymorpha]|uniref:Uncharacterized protein n=1 Tax=Dreissena polymorpha TaxID=45954 RepID=A0A9D4BCV3_DREPO|nr:hypothetical protein DPMN_194240 [Dreissena polymorpha]
MYDDDPLNAAAEAMVSPALPYVTCAKRNTVPIQTIRKGTVMRRRTPTIKHFEINVIDKGACVSGENG